MTIQTHVSLFELLARSPVVQSPTDSRLCNLAPHVSKAKAHDVQWALFVFSGVIQAFFALAAAGAGGGC